MPTWLQVLITDLEQLLANLFQQAANSNQVVKAKGCNPDQDPMCLSLCALQKSLEAAKAAASVHAALCCGDHCDK